ncbi:MAG: YidC/Oxa1 family membrane protein insertase [Clostridiales bacterium]|nr:YidC/Oxa1 family membrane protein insertase [Clostridiales bacterium]
MITAFLQIFGKILLWIYEFCHSYALSLIIFTLLSKLVLFPISYRGKKSMMQMNSLQVEVQKLQKQYAKDQNRLNQETQALYEREGVNPMGGCLWSFLPLPILMGLYYIIRRPMLYMMCLTNDEITAAVEAVTNLGYELGTTAAYQEMTLTSLMGKDPTVWNAVANAVGDSASKLVSMDFTWLGLDLSQTPSWKIWTLELNWANIGLFLIPIVVTVFSFVYSQISQKTNQLTMGNSQNKKDDASSAAADSTNKMMMYLMPLMYLWFGYIMPAGMCVYMLFNSVFSAVQEVVCAQMLKGKFEEMVAERERRANEEKEKEKERKAAIAARRAEQAEKNRKKGKRSKKGGVSKPKDHPTDASRVGIRPFARGRAYDPDRYPVTPYRDPQDVLDEAALEATLAKNAKRKKKKAEEEELPPEEELLLEETAQADEPAQTPDEAEVPEDTEEEAVESSGDDGEDEENV